MWVYLLHRDAPAILAAAYPHPLLAPRGGVDVHTVALAGDSRLLGLLEGLTDPRQKRGIRHRVAAVRTMVAAATLAGATSFRSVADYIGDLPPEALERLGARRHPRTRAVRGAERADDPAHRDLRRRGRGGRLGRALAGRAGARRAARRQGGTDLHHARAGRQDAQRLLGRAGSPRAYQRAGYARVLNSAQCRWACREVRRSDAPAASPHIGLNSQPTHSVCSAFAHPACA